MLFGQHAPPEAALAGFEHIKRFWDAPRQRFIAKILPGQFYVTRHQEVISTILGSCVSVCMRDAVAGIGAMNHFLLPRSGGHSPRNEIVAAEPCARYGIDAMEMMLDALERNGARRERLEVKVTGGGRIGEGMNDIGAHNAEFTHEYMQMNGFKLLACDLGGTAPRKVHYFPDTGKLLIKKLDERSLEHIHRREDKFLHRIES